MKKNTNKKDKKILKTLSAKIVYQNPWFYVQKEKVRYPDGKKGNYFILKRPEDFVVIVAKVNNQTLLVEQYRQVLKAKSWELPMGALVKGEDSLKGAQREFLEETGYKASKWKNMGSFFVGPGLTDQKGHVFLAEDIREAKESVSGEPGEIISALRWLNFEKVENLIRAGRINDGPSITAFFLVKKFLERGQK